jgi:phytoene dehydrogenase-like protein
MSVASEYRDTWSRSDYDAVVVGSGPNGLSAAITLAREGLSVLVVEGRDTIGGGLRSTELTLPGFIHDVCSAVLPMMSLSPFMRSVPWSDLGVDMAVPKFPLAHPLDGDRVALHTQSIAGTVNRLGKDGNRWEWLFGSVAANARGIMADLLGPLPLLPKHPFALANFGLRAAMPATTLAKVLFSSDQSRALFLGHAAHSFLPLSRPFTSAVGILLAVSAHVTGWPVARGGTGELANAMAAYLQKLGGEIVVKMPITRVDELPKARAYLFDTGPHALARIAGERLPNAFRKRLFAYRYGPGAFKLDLALSDPIPWAAQACRHAGTVHVCGSSEEVVAAEAATWRNQPPEKPFVLVVQPSLFDPTRAPAGKHTCWAYCHVPAGCTTDMTGAILDQIERFAPGFRDTILATHTFSPAAFQSYNPNIVGGDIIGGVQDLTQMFTRPVARLNPYTTPAPDIYICSASTPPGAGVHGMCGHHAATTALRRHW